MTNCISHHDHGDSCCPFLSCHFLDTAQLFPATSGKHGSLDNEYRSEQQTKEVPGTSGKTADEDRKWLIIHSSFESEYADMKCPKNFECTPKWAWQACDKGWHAGNTDLLKIFTLLKICSSFSSCLKICLSFCFLSIKQKSDFCLMFKKKSSFRIPSA